MLIHENPKDEGRISNSMFQNKNFGMLRKHDIHIKSKSYKLELLGELVI